MSDYDFSADPFTDEPSPRLNGGKVPPDEIRFRFTQFADIKIETAPPYLVDGILPRVGVAVVWGPPKCGKTFWIFDVEMHVALGWEYRGHRVEQGAVLHIACEGVVGLGARKEAWRITRLGENADDGTIPFFLCKDTALDLISDADKVIRDIGAQYGDIPIKVITIDTLNRSLVGSESRDEDMTKYLRAAVLLAAQFRCLVMVIHHCGYDESHPRGHTSLRGGADADIAVKKDAAGRVHTIVKNMRDGPEGNQTLSRLVSVNVGVDDNGNPITSCVIEPDGAPVSANETSQRPLPAAQRRALELLAAAIDKAGVVPSQCDHIPANTPCVNEGLWREYCYHGQIADSDKPDAKQKAFKRAATALLAANRVGKWGELLWLIR